ncbi:MAG: DUF3037 domain-containing protein [Methylococcales bacterium]
MKYYSGSYSIIQYCPSPSRKEVLNIGIFLKIPELSFQKIKVVEGIARLEKVFGEINKSFFNRELLSIDHALINRPNELLESINYENFIMRKLEKIRMTNLEVIKIFDPEQDIIDLYTEACSTLLLNSNKANSKQWLLLQNWHILFNAYIKDPLNHQTATVLIECLVNNLWPDPVDQEDVTMLLEMLPSTAHQAHNQEVGTDFTPLHLSDQNPILAPFKATLDQATSLLNKFDTDINNTNTVHQYTDCWLTIATIAEELELYALQDLVSLYADGCIDLLVHKENTQNKVQQLLNDWHATIKAYLKATNDRTLFISLIECLQNPLWGSPLSEDDSIMLLDMLENQPTEITNNSDKEPEPETSIEAIYIKPELIAMVSDEFTLLAKDFEIDIINTDEDATNIELFKTVLNEQEYKFENLAQACNTIRLTGLNKVFDQLSINMRARRTGDPVMSQSECLLFKNVLPLIQDYLQAINNPERCSSLVKYLQSDVWKKPLLENEADLLTKQLAQPIIDTQEINLETRKITVEAADISLELPEDVNQELLDSLLNELPVLTENFSSVIQRVIAGNDIQDLLEAQRIAHTLKGAGNIVGISGIATLTHHLEEILEQLTEQKLFPGKALANILMEAADCLEMMSDALLGKSQAPEQTTVILQQVLDWANQITVHGMPEEDIDLISHSTSPIKPETQVDQTIQPAKPDAVAMTRVPSSVVDKLLRITGESSVMGEQFKERTDRFTDELKTLRDLTWQMQTLVSELDQFVNIQSYTGQTHYSDRDNEFDALEMDQYNELHTSTSRIAEVATDIKEIHTGMEKRLMGVKELLVEQDRIQKENQEMVQSIRMVAAQTITSRCQRIVRQAARVTEKQVHLEIKGEDTLIDSEILNKLVDPIMHLLRNAVDHGIESSENRKQAKKGEQGIIQLEYSRKGNDVVVKCSDDGAGLNSNQILQTAINKGLLAKEKTLTETEINQLILIPGFSTRDKATQVSGRGIGMDAIYTQISAMQGVMTLVSKRGEGLEVTLTIPLTLSSMQSLLIKSGKQTLAVSSRGLQQIYHSESGELVRHNDKWGYQLEDMETGLEEVYPVRYFNELIGMANENMPDKKLPALRIEDASGKIKVVLVDEVLGYKNLLVKNMGHYIPNIPGVLGAAILGTGQVTPVVDLVELLHNTVKHQYLLTHAAIGLADGINGLPIALIVDDSLSARRSVTQLLQDSGFKTETAIDGLDAIKHIEKTVPDILIVDLEMPRMNGIELTAHVRSRTDMQNIPIIMITSRATEKHRKQAQAAGVSMFMTKPFSEDELITHIRTSIET